MVSNTANKFREAISALRLMCVVYCIHIQRLLSLSKLSTFDMWFKIAVEP